MIQKLVPTPAFVIRETKTSRFDGQSHQKLAWSLVVVAVLLVIATIIFAPKYHVGQYNAKAAPIVEQLENEMQVMRMKAFDPDLEVSNDLGLLNDRYNKQLKQVGQSEATLDNLRRNLDDVSVSIGARAQHAEVSELVTTFEAIVADGRSMIEVKIKSMEAIRTLNVAAQRLRTSFNDPTATYEEAAAAAREAQVAAQGLADSIRALDVREQSKRYAELTATRLQQSSDGYSILIAALEKQDGSNFLAAMQKLNSDIERTDKEMTEETNKQLNDSVLTRNFEKFDTQLEEVKASF